MRVLRVSVAAGLLWGLAAGASGQSLTVGDSAPKLSVSKWVKGEKVDRLEPGQTYVVEFWATWCGPCRATIPHLTELQKKHKDVKFIGVSVFEQDQSKVAPFVKEMGEKMGYAVAMDDVPEGAARDQGKMAQTWMVAAEQDGIPTAFIVTKGKVAWIGHPMEMDGPLAKVVAGDFDISAAAAKYREEKVAERKLAAVLEKLRPALQAQDHKEALAVLDKALADDAALEGRLGPLKFNLMLQAGDTGAAGYGRKLVEGACKDDAGALNNIAWSLVDPDSKLPAARRDARLAVRAAERANELTKGEDPAILDTLAKACFDSGDPARALELQEKAVRRAKDANPDMTDRLEQYRKAVREKAKDKDKDREPKP
jgi:thiol-disulfide isomerase/thioredoxin